MFSAKITLNQSESDFIRKIEKYNDSTNNHSKFIGGPNYPLPNHTIIIKTKMGNFEHNGLKNITRKKHHQFQKFHISKT